MRLMTWNRPTPARPAATPAEDDFNRVLNAFWGELSLPAAGYVPRIDVSESADSVVVLVDLPGVERKHLALTFEQGVLTLQGQRPAEHAGSGAQGWTRVERSYGQFERQIRLGEGYDGSQVRAELKDGVLTVHIAKLEKAKPHVIEIQ